MKQVKYLDIVYPKNEEAKKFAEVFTEWVYRQFFKKKAKLLDVGCGRGYYSDGFKKLGFEVKSCDLEPVNKNVNEVNLEKDKFPYSSGSFDFIFCKGVIAHLWNPHLMLEEMKRVLKLDGIIFISTGDFSRSYKVFWDDFTHKHPYTKKSFRQILEYHDFKIIKWGGFTHFPYIWRWFGWRVFNMHYPFRSEIYCILKK